MNPATAPENPPDLDFREHLSTYRGFLEMTKVAMITVASLLMGLLIITYGNGVPVIGGLIVVAAIAGAAVGYSAGPSWKPAAIVLVCAAVISFFILI